MKTAEEILNECIGKYNQNVNDMSKFSLNKKELQMFSNCMKMYSNQKLDECASQSKEMIYDSNEEIKSLNKEGLHIRKFQHTYATPKQLILSLKDIV